jgi:hypothetical protein
MKFSNRNTLGPAEAVSTCSKAAHLTKKLKCSARYRETMKFSASMNAAERTHAMRIERGLICMAFLSSDS